MRNSAAYVDRPSGRVCGACTLRTRVLLCDPRKLTLEAAAAAQMSKAEKAMQKKDKAKAFSAKKNAGAAVKNAKRWG